MSEALIPVKTKRISVGDRFGRLVVDQVGRTEDRRYLCVCHCDCGRVGLIAQFEHLETGSTVSCGCATKDRMTTHGQSSHRLFKRWQSMMGRCYRPRASGYENYGARGIRVCERWHDPAAFLADMAGSFVEGLELDRYPDNDGDYEPGNVRWATPKQNQYNRRITNTATYKGRTMPLGDWSTEIGIPLKLLTKRIVERGWQVERAFETPILSKSEIGKIANAAFNAKRDARSTK